MAAVRKIYKLVLVNTGGNSRLFTSLLRLQLANASVKGRRGLRIFSRRFCLSQVSMVKNSDNEWKTKLTPEQFWVCRQKGTEPPWSGEYVDFKGKGTYKCICCGSDLFSSAAKFDSGTGWPSFNAAIETTPGDGQSSQLSVVETSDHSHGMTRVEVLCRQVRFLF